MPQEFFQIKNIDTPSHMVMQHKVIKDPIILSALDASIILGLIKPKAEILGETWIERVLRNGSE